jgi:hypothetical protein
VIDGDRVSAVCADDWGLWRTATGSIARVASSLEAAAWPEGARVAAQRRLATLAARIDERPKSMRWRMRARVGERVRWYEEPDEK